MTGRPFADALHRLDIDGGLGVRKPWNDDYFRTRIARFFSSTFENPRVLDREVVVDIAVHHQEWEVTHPANAVFR